MLSILFFGCSDMKYRSGRDTIKSFGNGRFQVLHASDQTKVLYDLQQQQTIARDIEDWRVIANNVCTFDQANKMFIVLNLNSGQFNKYKDVYQVPEKLQSALKIFVESKKSYTREKDE